MVQLARPLTAHCCAPDKPQKLRPPFDDADDRGCRYALGVRAPMRCRADRDAAEDRRTDTVHEIGSRPRRDFFPERPAFAPPESSGATARPAVARCRRLASGGGHQVVVGDLPTRAHLPRHRADGADGIGRVVLDHLRGGLRQGRRGRSMTCARNRVGCELMNRCTKHRYRAPLHRWTSTSRHRRTETQAEDTCSPRLYCLAVYARWQQSFWTISES
jgi:hypothetical protein